MRRELANARSIIQPEGFPGQPPTAVNRPKGPFGLGACIHIFNSLAKFVPKIRAPKPNGPFGRWAVDPGVLLVIIVLELVHLAENKIMEVLE